MPFVRAHKYFGKFLSNTFDFLISVKKWQEKTAIFTVLDDKNDTPPYLGPSCSRWLQFQ